MKIDDWSHWPRRWKVPSPWIINQRSTIVMAKRSLARGNHRQRHRPWTRTGPSPAASSNQLRYIISREREKRSPSLVDPMNERSLGWFLSEIEKISTRKNIDLFCLFFHTSQQQLCFPAENADPAIPKRFSPAFIRRRRAQQSMPSDNFRRKAISLALVKTFVSSLRSDPKAKLTASSSS